MDPAASPTPNCCARRRPAALPTWRALRPGAGHLLDQREQGVVQRDRGQGVPVLVAPVHHRHEVELQDQEGPDAEEGPAERGRGRGRGRGMAEATAAIERQAGSLPRWTPQAQKQPPPHASPTRQALHPPVHGQQAAPLHVRLAKHKRAPPVAGRGRVIRKHSGTPGPRTVSRSAVGGTCRGGGADGDVSHRQQGGVEVLGHPHLARALVPLHAQAGQRLRHAGGSASARGGGGGTGEGWCGESMLRLYCA